VPSLIAQMPWEFPPFFVLVSLNYNLVL
jgi:hypothetical protein